MAKRCKGQKYYVGKLSEIDESNRLVVMIDKGNIYIPLEIIKKAQVEIEFGVPNKKVKE
jgi:ribosome maturation factor RimP